MQSRVDKKDEERAEARSLVGEDGLHKPADCDSGIHLQGYAESGSEAQPSVG